jgi:hypothetical protein
MARAPKDYAKLYKNSIIQIEKSNEICYELRKKVERYYLLNKEFDKAVAINKEFQETIVQQRGIIHYLEMQVRAIDQKLTNMEKE